MFIVCSDVVETRKKNSPGLDTTRMLNELLADDSWLESVSLKYLNPLKRLMPFQYFYNYASYIGFFHSKAKLFIIFLNPERQAEGSIKISFLSRIPLVSHQFSQIYQRGYN